MRVLIMSINYWPEVTGIGAFTTYRAEHLAAAGHDVEVCTTFPYYPDWKVREGYRGKLASSEERNGVRILRSYAYVPSQVTSAKRILHEISFIISSLVCAIMRKRPDILVVVSPPLGLAMSAILLSRLWRTPYVFDVEDLQPDSAADFGMLPRWAVKLLYKVESAAYRHAALVTTLTVSMKKRIIDKGITEEKVELLEPRMDDTLSGITPEEGVLFRKHYELDNKFLVTYSGNMGVKQGLDIVLDAAYLNRSDDMTLFLLVGSGAESGRIQSRSKEMNLRNVRFLPLLDQRDFRGLLAASGVCLVTQQYSVTEIAFPSKIVTYLSAGCPIIASVNPDSEVANIAMESGAGRVVRAGEPEALLAAIKDLREANLDELGENARRYASLRWAPDRVLRQLEQSLTAVVASQ